MKNENSFLRLLAMLALVSPTLAFAQDHSGNGGISVVCRNARHEVVSAELLDLWEAKNDRGLGLTFSSSMGTVEQELTRAIGRIKAQSEKLGYDAKVLSQRIRSQIKPLSNPDSTGITLPNDFHPRLSVKGDCKFEAAAKYLPNGDIQLDPEIVAHFNPRNRAALTLHEAVYLAARENAGAKDSDSTRLIVGQAFASNSVTMDVRAVLEDVDHDWLVNRTLISRGEGQLEFRIQDGDSCSGSYFIHMYAFGPVTSIGGTMELGQNRNFIINHPAMKGRWEVALTRRTQSCDNTRLQLETTNWLVSRDKDFANQITTRSFFNFNLYRNVDNSNQKFNVIFR